MDNFSNVAGQSLVLVKWSTSMQTILWDEMIDI